ncbi:ubiquitin-conjugating enzyme E2 J2-like [Daktulosphaira vitifoliae]|uniref:ubiquitin-conjugating enzyme E2 J2-like n=1 Tax=Daktulosphaira vitifoliae TaxID=58002 RepID=UPI0021AA9819|nr:ubiquitin-conjugating enzyme E2 J2-like [Daktulosphaira vitifoliae]XP_050525993.1 ubiquitin-conjugating enzyme E2 J2-like [Daktulosphaira vitifoliae]
MAPKTSSATLRLKQDYVRLKNDPVPYVVAEPVPSNILEWYYVVSGPDDSPYAGGYYLGRLVFPRDFPFKPPSIYMITPNGRFKTNTRLCLSISDYHPDTWNPAWSVSTILTGLLSFMLENSPTMGSIEMTEYERRQLAAQSLETNLNDENFCELFPDLTTTIRNEIEKRNSARANVVNSPNPDNTTPDNNIFQSVIYNSVVMIGFALFIYLVRYVLYNMNTE